MSIEEIKSLLETELRNFIFGKVFLTSKRYLNEDIGDVSIIIAALLDHQLLLDNKWEPEKWIDDILISKIDHEEKKLKFWGVAIWGMVNTTEQWTDPFYCEIEMEAEIIKNVILYFGDQDNDSTIYSFFRLNRGIWDTDFYTSSFWEISERRWSFIIPTSFQSIL